MIATNTPIGTRVRCAHTQEISVTIDTPRQDDNGHWYVELLHNAMVYLDLIEYAGKHAKITVVESYEC